MKHALSLSVLLLCAPGAAWSAPGDHFVENWDLDGDGTVILAEIEERRGAVFAAFDADEDERLDAGEYVYFDEARANDMADNADHGGGRMQRASEGMTLGFNDTDGDGAVSLAEFLDGSAAWLAMIDRNEDGVVTRADFGNR